MIINLALVLALVAVAVVERAQASRRIDKLNARHQRKIRSVASEYYHQGYRKALFFWQGKPNS